MSVLKKFIKQPVDRLDYDIDYSKWLTDPDHLVSTNVVIDQGETPEDGDPLVLEAVVVEPTFIKLWISGGTAGITYKLSCTTTTDKDRVKQDEIKIRVKDY